MRNATQKDTNKNDAHRINNVFDHLWINNVFVVLVGQAYA